MTATPAREPHPQRCRKLFVNSDHVLSCIAPFADDITNEKCIEGKGECEFREVPATHTSPPAAEPDVKAKIVEIMTVAAHCKDRTYGEVADEIITLLSRQHTPVAEQKYTIRMADAYLEGFKEGAKAERERALAWIDEFEQYRKAHSAVYGDAMTFHDEQEVIDKMKDSFRAQPESTSSREE